MKRLFLILILLLACASGSHEQGVKIAGPVKVAGPVTFGGTSTCSPSDTFSGSGALSANWTSPETSWAAGTLTRGSGVVIESGSFTQGIALWTNCSLPNNQYAQVVWTSQGTANSGYGGGPMVRASASGNGYQLGTIGGSATTPNVDKCTAGSCSFLLACPAMNIGDTMKLDATGTTITCTDVTTPASTNTTDSTYPSGYVGVFISNAANGGATGVELASFSAGTP